MRVALVTALSYPSFVGGATLQVHRIARALKAHGHDVRVFSGARRPGEKALATNAEQTDGIPITSVNTEDYLGFANRDNFDNRGVAEVLSSWAAEYEPEVVHAHALQGIGATWIDEVAARRPVVVTMHDWWWICARQFLVNEDMCIDAPVADLVGCPCSGGVAFNQERRAWLKQRLDHVSQILVPSSSMRDSLLVNGFDPARVAVDENGVEPLDAAGPREVVEGPPHLGFVGGWHDFKGLPLLMEARRRLPDEPLPMRITCWGAAESVETRRLPAGVTVEPAYGPDETATVMRSLDALVVPSLMRESFSIVAREALLAGVPVICSDSGGPEEVVHHGSNGLVVESGNPAAWAAALARWSGDPQLRQRLSRGAGARPAGVIDLTGQAAHLEQVYAGLPVPPRPKAATPAAPPDLLIISGIEGAPLRYRAHQLAAAHRALGGRITLLDHRHRRIPEAISTGGLVVFYRVPWSTWTRTCVEAAQGRGAHVVFSVDDLIFTPELRDRIPAVRSLPPTEAEQWMEGVRRYQDTARACGVVLASTPAIAEAAKAQGLVAAIQPNGLSTETALLSQAALWCTREERAERRAGGVVRMGYLSGTTTHDTDWAMIEPAIAKVLQEREDAELWLIGPVRVGADLDQHPRVRRIGFRPYQELPRVQAELDIVLAPLEPDLEFSEAKSAVKWVEAAACRIPVVASPTGPFRTAIEHGVTGVLAGPTDWYDQVDHLAGDADAREQIGRAARADVYLRHGPAALAEAWARTYPKLLEARPANLVAAALPSAAQDEHPTVPSLEPEPSGGYLDAQPTPAVRTSSRLGGAAVLETTLQCRYPRLCRVDIRTATFGASAVAELELELRDGARVVRQGRIGPDAIADDGWTAWAFDPATTSGGPELTLRLTQPEAPAGRGIAWWASDESTLCVRTWAYAGRDEICAFAMGASAGRSAAYRRPNAAIALWHKGRHSLASQGASATSQRVVRYVRRWWRGRRARRRTGS